MRHKYSIVLLLSFLAAFSSKLSADEVAPITDANKKQIEQLVHDYIVSNPEVLVEASKALRGKEVQKAIKEHADTLFTSPGSPVIGNKNGTITVVEFFDYQCPHCKHMDPVLLDVIKKNPEVKVILKEFPIFGESSKFASSAALAANVQGKYWEFHTALMKGPDRLAENQVLDIAKSVGINVDKLKTDQKSTPVEEEIKRNYSMAEVLTIQGTPALLIGIPGKDQPFEFIQGAAPAEDIQTAIDKVKKTS